MFVGDKDNIITAFEKIGYPLTENQIRCLQEVTEELKKNGLSQDFAIMEVKCRVCSYQVKTIVPLVADLENLGCSNCGNKTCQEVADDADEKELWQE